MLLELCAYARPLPVMPPDIAEMLQTVGPAGLDDCQDEIFRHVLGLEPGWPEAFATDEARDAALGPHGPYISFIPTTFKAGQKAGFATHQIAIGHQLSDPDFHEVAPTVLKAMIPRMEDEHEGTVVIGRVAYRIGVSRGEVAVAACPEFDIQPDPSVVAETMRWLEDRFAPVLRRQLTAQA